jgi:hypothetical protein
MKTIIRRTALTSIAILFLLGGANAAFASNSPTLSTTVIGGVSNLGTQVYNVKGGQTAFAMIAGQMINASTADLKYHLMVTQNGLTTKGYATLRFSGMTTGGDNVSVSGTFDVNSIVPAAELPLGCSTNCQSALPFFFLGTSSNVQMTVAGFTQTVPETMQIESPYFNPWGAPIVLASTDNSIVIAATYTKGSIMWTGTKVGGAMSGTLGTTQTSGMFNMTSNESENLVTGKSIDSGTISFSSMTPSSLNAKGHYVGTSTIPTTGTYDCSASTGVPGTCTETGFQSIGRFTMGGISGNYNTAWGVPALGFSASVSATISHNDEQHGQH